MTRTSLTSCKRSISSANTLADNPAPSRSVNGFRKSLRLAKSVKGNPPCIGIDLGTSHARISVYRHGKVEIIANDRGSRSTPSYVAFGNNQRLIGNEAENQAAVNPLNTVFDAKRLLGRQCKDVDEKYWPFEVVADDRKSKVKVNYRGEMKTFFPEEITSMLLLKMKQTAEAYVGNEVTDAVISVPANFNDSQRQATRDAGTIAGLNVVRILNDPTAAAIAFGIKKKMEGEETILVVDLGGGTLDASIVTVGKFSTRRTISVKSTAGNSKLGGLNFDNRMVDHFAQEFYSKHQKDLLSNPRSLLRLRLACDQAKRTLSHANQASIAIAALLEDIDFTACITRVRFEYLCADLFSSVLDTVKKALNDAGISKDMLDEIILMGGSSSIPKIQKLLGDFFGGRELYNFDDSDGVVASGAAIQAAILHRDTSNAIQDFQVSDISPLTWDLLVDEGVIKYTSCIVKKNSKIPRDMQVSFTCTATSPNEFVMKLYEGEEREAEDEDRREYSLLGLPLSTPGVLKTSITFDIDANGLLNIAATENANGHLEKYAVRHDPTRLSSSEIEKLVTDAAYQRDLDNLWLERRLAKNSLESYCLKMIEAVEHQKTEITESEGTTALNKCHETIQWIDDNPLVNQEKFEEKLEDAKNVCKTITSTTGDELEDESEDFDYDVSDIDSDDDEASNSDEDDGECEELVPIKKSKHEC